MALQAQTREKLSDIVFNEPLSAETESKRRNLLFVACFAILLAVYDLKVSRTPWLDFDVPDGAPNILHGAISAALVYTMVVFVLHALADLLRWRSASGLIALHNYYNLTLKAHNHLNAVSQWLDKPLPENKGMREPIDKMYSEAVEFFDSLKATVDEGIGRHGALSRVHMARIVVLDLGVPIALGGFAMIKIGSALLPFLAVATN